MNLKEKFCTDIKNNEKSMYALAFSLVKNDADASEILSEAILRAYENYGKLKNPGAFRPWILKTVHNTAVQYIRKNAKYALSEETELYEKAEEGDITEKIALGDAVKALKEPYRTAVTLFYYEDMSVSDISYVTGDSENAVKKQLSRGRNMLREMLKEDFCHE